MDAKDINSILEDEYIQNSVIKIFIEKCHDKTSEEYITYKTWERKWEYLKLH